MLHSSSSAIAPDADSEVADNMCVAAPPKSGRDKFAASFRRRKTCRGEFKVQQDLD